MSSLEGHLQRQIEASREFFWHRLRWSLVRSYLPRTRPFRLLDFGAGAGILGEYLLRERPQGTYLFVEPLASLERHLERRFGALANARGVQGDLDVEYVALLDVLEHQAEDTGFLRDVVARMGQGSVLMLTVPALHALWSDWDDLLGHHRRYDRQMLRRLLEGLPVAPLEISYVFPELLPAALMRRAVRRATPDRCGSAEFPDLPRLANDALVAVGRASLALRRWWPAGTSLFTAVRRL